MPVSLVAKEPYFTSAFIKSFLAFDFVIIFTTPPVVPLPYKVAPPPGIISIFSIAPTGIELIGKVPIASSKGVIVTPSTIVFTLLIERSPLPLRLTTGPNSVS